MNKFIPPKKQQTSSNIIRVEKNENIESKETLDANKASTFNKKNIVRTKTNDTITLFSNSTALNNKTPLKARDSKDKVVLTGLASKSGVLDEKSKIKQAVKPIQLSKQIEIEKEQLTGVKVNAIATPSTQIPKKVHNSTEDIVANINPGSERLVHSQSSKNFIANQILQEEMTSTEAKAIKVICRFRPMNETEKKISDLQCVNFLDKENIKLISKSENNTFNFNFDTIFDPDSKQKDVFEVTAKPIISSVFEGFNGTILAYGQTSSGKTHTMQGVFDNEEKEGIIPRLIKYIYEVIRNSNDDIEYLVKVSMFEIYREKIRDLLDIEKTNLKIREEKGKGMFISDITEKFTINEDEILSLMKIGSSNRAIGETNMNDQSSRSHSIFCITINQNNAKDCTAKSGKLYLVDLAGSEKISKTGATGLILEEAKMINKSLTTLGMVINALTDPTAGHIPYRESKLTRILQESLGGNSKTCLIITCSPSVFNESETLSTLRFGKRSKNIKNKPIINKEVSVQELKLEIQKLEHELKEYKAKEKENLMTIHSLQQKNTKVTDIGLDKDIDDLDLDDSILSTNRDAIDILNKSINTKYNEVLDKVSNLEEEKNNLMLLLNEAQKIISRINDEKDTYEKMLNIYNQKIKDLESKLEENRFAINASYFKKAGCNDDVSFCGANANNGPSSPNIPKLRRDRGFKLCVNEVDEEEKETEHGQSSGKKDISKEDENEEDLINIINSRTDKFLKKYNNTVKEVANDEKFLQKGLQTFKANGMRRNSSRNKK